MPFFFFFITHFYHICPGVQVDLINQRTSFGFGELELDQLKMNRLRLPDEVWGRLALTDTPYLIIPLLATQGCMLGHVTEVH